MSIVKLYHYTNLNAFKNIIESGDIWFTRVDSLNDYSEFNYYKDVFNSVREKFLQREDRMLYDYDKLFITDWADRNLVQIRDSYYKETFAFSLTTHSDSIPMWNYYSDKAGIAIGFDRDKLVNQIILSAKPITASPCYIEYNKESQAELIWNRFEEILKITNDKNLLHNDDELLSGTRKGVNDVLGNMWGESWRFKNESFEYENEFRITLCRLDNTQNKINEVFEIVNNSIKPVLKLSVTENWNGIITDIIISPFSASEQLAENIKDFLNSKNIPIENINVIKSKCPIRNL